jgi:hypothetical protein
LNTEEGKLLQKFIPELHNNCPPIHGSRRPGMSTSGVDCNPFTLIPPPKPRSDFPEREIRIKNKSIKIQEKRKQLLTSVFRNSIDSQ